MRNGVRGSETTGLIQASDSQRHRKGGVNKRQLQQQSSTMALGAHYTNNNLNTNTSNVNNNFMNSASTRSYSKNGGGGGSGAGRKSHSIKHKSSKVQIPLTVNQNSMQNPSAKQFQNQARQLSHSKQGYQQQMQQKRNEHDSISGLNVSQQVAVGLDSADYRVVRSSNANQFQDRQNLEPSQFSIQNGRAYLQEHQQQQSMQLKQQPRNHSPAPNSLPMKSGGAYDVSVVVGGGGGGGYQQNQPRSTSKVNTKHRKLTKQPSVAQRDIKNLPLNERVVLDNSNNHKQQQDLQFQKLKAATKGTNKHQQELLQSAAVGLDGKNLQQLMAQNTFSVQPDFIVSGSQHQQLSSSAQGIYGQNNQTIVAPTFTRGSTVLNSITDGSANLFALQQQDGNRIGKKVQTFGKKQTSPHALPQMVSSSTVQAQLTQHNTNGSKKKQQPASPSKLVGSTINNLAQTPERNRQHPQQRSTSHAQQNFEVTRQQQLLQQQVRQQQNVQQHLQFVNLEIKGSTKNVPSSQGKNGLDDRDLQVQSPQVGQIVAYGGTSPITQNQQLVAQELSSELALSMQQQSPRTVDINSMKKQNIFVHNPPVLDGSPINNISASAGQHKVLMPQGDSEMIQRHTNGLQNSKSPFKAKQSQKLLQQDVHIVQKWSKNGGASDSIANIQQHGSSPQVVIKKKHSAKNSLRKHSANNGLHSSNGIGKAKNVVSIVTAHPRNSMPSVLNNINHAIEQHQAGLGTGSIIPPTNDYIKVVPVQGIGQKGLKTQSSQLKIDYNPQNSQPNHNHSPLLQVKQQTFNSSYGVAPYNQVSQETPQNMSGLLNMSKQRACTMDVSQTKPNMVITDNLDTTTYQQHNSSPPRFVADQQNHQIEAQGVKRDMMALQQQYKHTTPVVSSSKKHRTSNNHHSHHKSVNNQQQQQQPSESLQSQQHDSNLQRLYSHSQAGINSNIAITSGKKASIAASGYDVSFQKSGKQIVQGQQFYQQQHNAKMAESVNSSGIDNSKTLPLSVFEMQFYQGDFVLQQNKIQQQNSQLLTQQQHLQQQQQLLQQQQQYQSGSGQVIPSQFSQQMNNSNITAANGGKPQYNNNFQQQQQQLLHKNGGISSTSLVKGNKNGGNDSINTQQQQQMEMQDRQKVNFVALQNFHQQWLSTHSVNSGSGVGGNSIAVQAAGVGVSQPMMPLMKGSLSHTHLQEANQQQQPSIISGSPSKTLAAKHHNQTPVHQGGSTIVVPHTSGSQQNYHPNKLQQMTMAAAANIQPSQINAMQQNQNNPSIYGGPVSINGRQLQMPIHQTLIGMNQHSQAMGSNLQQMQMQSRYHHHQMPQSIQEMHQYHQQQQASAIQYHLASMSGVMVNPEDIQIIHKLGGGIQSNMLINATQTSQEQRGNLRRKDTNMFKRAVSKIPFENAYVEDCYKFIIGYGNNSGLIRNALKARSWWIEIQPVHSMFNFKWNPVSDGIKFARLGHLAENDGKKQEKGTMGQTSVKENAKDQQIVPIQNKNSCQMVNHFEHHQLLTEKYNLLMVMQRFSDLHKENTFDLMPITFFVEIPDATKEHLVSQALSPFVTFYQALESNKSKLTQLKEQLIRQLHHKVELEEKEKEENAAANGQAKPNQAFQNRIQQLESVTGAQQSNIMNSGKTTKFKAFNFEKRTHQRYTMPLCHFDSFNLWLLKPTNLNRGRGIHVFRDVDTLNKLIKQYCTGQEQVSKKKSQPVDNPDKQELDALNENPDQAFESDQEDQIGDKSHNKTASPSKKTSSAPKIKHNTFIIQKYIERPLLIYKRKFDIRVWVLLNQDHDLFFFKEGYLRTSSSEYGIDLQNIDNAFVHLTNNAVQKNAENYGDFEDGNQLSFPAFQDYIDEHYSDSGVSVFNHLVPQMHEVILKTFNAVRRTLDPNRRKYCFELFGYDFILDEDFNSWLIEVNTNPCLEESSELLKRLLPRMIEDMFKLTVDVQFPKSSIRRRKDLFKKKMASSSAKKGDYMNSPQKRVSTANKLSVQLQSTEEQSQSRYKAGATTDSEGKQPLEKSIVRQKTNSSNEANKNTEHTATNNNSSSVGGGDFTSQANISQSLQPDSDNNKDEADGAKPNHLMTIKEKLNRGRTYPVPGYNDSENMWHKLQNLEKETIPNPNKYINNKSVYSIMVQDKIFKMRKNPLYTGQLNLPELQPDPAELKQQQEQQQLLAQEQETEAALSQGADYETPQDDQKNQYGSP